MNILCMQVETMIKKGKTEDDSICKINTLKSILAMLDISLRIYVKKMMNLKKK